MNIHAPYLPGMFVFMNFVPSLNFSISLVNSSVICLVAECNLIKSKSFLNLTIDNVSYLKTGITYDYIYDPENTFIFSQGLVTIKNSKF